MNSRKGFTLIELLVVISIIGFLTSVVLGTLNSAREKALVAKAKIDLRQLAKAAQLVYDDYGYYPNDSHGSIICPRDIIIDPNSGKKWDYYTSICTDPWGNPYEWNNFCTNNERRAPHEPFNPVCISFDINDQGRVGTLYAGKDGINDGCSDDDICFGENGFSDYGMTSGSSSGQENPPPDPEPVPTVTVTSDKSSVSFNESFSLTWSSTDATTCTKSGSWSGTAATSGTESITFISANETYTLECSGEGGSALESVSVTYVPPVLMCVANITSCDQLSTIECSTRNGCSVSGTSCTGTFTTSCVGFNQTQCSDASCTWTTSGNCGGTVSCSAYASNQTSCTINGCAFIPSACSGTPSCATWNNTSASTCTTNHPGCTWASGSKKCNGTITCSSYTSASCATSLGCTVTASSCSGAPTCTAFNQSQCTGASGCTWTVTGSCSGSFNSNCTTYNSNQTSCQSTSGCIWTPASCTGTAASCSTFSDQTSCSTQVGCTWQ
jgi:type II secretion system protein G